MSRIAHLIAVVTATTLLTPALSLAQKDGLTPGEPFAGEMTLKSPKVNNYYTAEVPVTLKAGQNVSIKATVTGSTRYVSLALRDPAGTVVEQTPNTLKSNELKTEANATGKHTIVVQSLQIGAFKLLVVTEAGEGDEGQALEAKVEQLKRELSEAEAKLRAFRKKTVNRPQQ